MLAPLACLVYAVPGVDASLHYDRDAIAAGQAWRLFTCHLTHWDPAHLSWDVACFAALAAACAARGVAPARTWAALGVASALIPAAVWVFMPYAETYRGLSGLVSALFALLAADLVRRRRPSDRAAAVLAACVTAALLAKCAFDLRIHWQLAGPSAPDAAAAHAYPLFSDFIPAPVAHLAGAAVGIVAGIFPPRRPRAA